MDLVPGDYVHLCTLGEVWIIPCKVTSVTDSLVRVLTPNSIYGTELVRQRTVKSVFFNAHPVDRALVGFSNASDALLFARDQAFAKLNSLQAAVVAAEEAVRKFREEFHDELNEKFTTPYIQEVKRQEDEHSA